MSYYAIDKSTLKIAYGADNLWLLKKSAAADSKSIDDYLITRDVDMKYVSRIAYVDGVCVYNKKSYWLSNAPDEVAADFDNHTVIDFLGLAVDSVRFNIEMNSNRARISAIDGRAGQVEYNMTVGDEYIALFREECVLTDFTSEANTTPLLIAQKLSSVIGLVQTGSFREAKLTLKSSAAAGTLYDDFLTESRINKYIDLLEAADAIDYATEEDYYYTVPESATE